MFKVLDVVRICNAKLLQGDSNRELGNLCKDTRILKDNDTYVGIKGENFDGNDFYMEAIKKGAKVCILEKEVTLPLEYSDISILVVDSSILCLQKLAKEKINNFSGKIVAITGSVGKTSTKDLVYSVVNTKYKTLKTLGNNNNNIGLPLTILRCKDEEVMILEMGMNNFKEISLLSNIAKPDIAIITNIGTAHIGNLGSRKNILKAKLEILEGLKDNGKLIINNDNDLLHEYYLENRNSNIITIGIDNNSHYLASNIKFQEDLTVFNINNKEYSVNVPSKVFVYNSLVAYAVGNILGIEDSLIKKGIENFELTKNRLDIKYNKKGIVIIDDTYNASFDSVKASLEILKNRKEKRKIAVLGDILELGSYSKEIHKSIAKEVIKSNIDILITVGNEIKYLLEELKEKNYEKEVYWFSKYDDAYDTLDKILDKGDVILLKASHSVNLTEIVNHLMK